MGLDGGFGGELIARRIGLGERRRGRQHEADGCGEDRNQDRGGHAPPRHQPVEAAGEPEHHQRVDQQQRERGEEDRAAQILRLAGAVIFDARIERGEVDRRQPVRRRQRIDGDEPFRRAVEAGRIVGGGAAGEGGQDRPRGRRRRLEGAVAVEHAGRRYRIAGVRGAGLGVGFGRRDRTRQSDDALEHVHEGPGQWQVGPARIGRDMKQHDQPLAPPGCSDQRCSVAERRPAMVGQPGVRLRQDLARHRDVVRHQHAVERAFARERRQLLGLVPAQAAAENAAAAAQLDRYQLVVGGGEPRAGKAYQHAALVDPARQAVARVAGDVADIGEDDHRQALLDELGDRLAGRAAFGEPDVGERPERPRQVEGRGEQGLRGVGGRAGDDADGAPPPPLVEQLNRAGGMLAADLQAGDVVADLDGKIEHRVGFAVARLEGVTGFAERQSLEVEGAHGTAVVAAGGRAQHLHRQHAGGIVGGGERMGRFDAAVDHGDRALVDEPRQCADEFAGAPGIDAVGEPDQLDVAGPAQEAVERGERLGALDGLGLRLDQAQPRLGGARGLQRNVAVGVGHRQDGDAAAIGVGAGDEVLGGADARIPARRRAPAVVNHDQQRRAAMRGRDRWIPQRAGGGDDDQRGEGEPQQRQPPRRPCRGFFLGRDVEQHARRRKIDPARARRHQPQQPPQHRQAEQAEQDQRFGEGEG